MRTWLALLPLHTTKIYQGRETTVKYNYVDEKPTTLEFD